MDRKQREELFDQLISQYGEELRRFARSRVTDWHEAQEVLQTFLIRVWRSLHTVRSDVRGWLYKVLKNQICDHYRRRREPLIYLNPRKLDLPAETSDVRDDLHSELLAFASSLGGASGRLVRTILEFGYDQEIIAEKLKPGSKRYLHTGTQHIRDSVVRAARVAYYREWSQTVKLVESGVLPATAVSNRPPAPYALFSCDYLTLFEEALDWRPRARFDYFKFHPGQYILPGSRAELSEWTGKLKQSKAGGNGRSDATPFPADYRTNSFLGKILSPPLAVAVEIRSIYWAGACLGGNPRYEDFAFRKTADLEEEFDDDDEVDDWESVAPDAIVQVVHDNNPPGGGRGGLQPGG
jgi:RNA polymerase sigma factor (sigma-70 family)